MGKLSIQTSRCLNLTAMAAVLLFMLCSAGIESAWGQAANRDTGVEDSSPEGTSGETDAIDAVGPAQESEQQNNSTEEEKPEETNL